MCVVLFYRCGILNKELNWIVDNFSILANSLRWNLISISCNILELGQSKQCRPRSNMWGSRNFRQGGVQVSVTKKALTFFFFFLVLSLFYRSQMVNFKEIYHFWRFQRGSNIFQGGSNFFQGGGGVLLLISYRNPYNLWFSRGGGPDPLSPPLDPHLSNCSQGLHCLLNITYYEIISRYSNRFVKVYYNIKNYVSISNK